MTIKEALNKAEELLKNVSDFEKKGLDTSSLKIFVKSLRTFQKIQDAQTKNIEKNLSFEEKLDIIKSFLEDKKVFPRIADVISFANTELALGFKDQKESREVTIKRILGRINQTPEIKEKIKQAVTTIRNNQARNKKLYSSPKDLKKVENFSKWAEILIKL